MDTNSVITNLLDAVTLFLGNMIGLIIVGGVYIVLSIFLGRIFSKAGRPFIAAFVPVWNIITFYKLGGYSALWVIAVAFGYAYSFGSAILSSYQALGAEWAQAGWIDFLIVAMPIAFPVSVIPTVATSIVGLLAAYNIGRAFDKDSGYLLLFVFCYPIWVIALSFTSYDWDEDSAHPNSIGETDRTAAARERARESANNRQRASKFLEPTSAYNRSRDINDYESDYDRAVREQEARGGIPPVKGKRAKKKAEEAKIVDAGSSGVSTDSEWFTLKSEKK